MCVIDSLGPALSLMGGEVTRIRIGTVRVAEEKLHEIVRWVEDHAWNMDAIC